MKNNTSKLVHRDNLKNLIFALHKSLVEASVYYTGSDLSDAYIAGYVSALSAMAQGVDIDAEFTRFKNTVERTKIITGQTD